MGGRAKYRGREGGREVGREGGREKRTDRQREKKRKTPIFCISTFSSHFRPVSTASAPISYLVLVLSHPSAP